MRPLISFAYDPSVGRSGLPLADKYQQAVRAFMQRYPYVRLYTAWNEPNGDWQRNPSTENPNEPAARDDPVRVAELYLKLANECDQVGCTAAAGNFLIDNRLASGNAKRTWPGTTNPKTYLGAFIGKVKASGRTPDAWAVNDYLSGNHLDPRRLEQFLRATQTNPNAPVNADGPNVWMVEQGGLVRRNGGKYDPPEDSQNFVVGHAVRAVRYYVGNDDADWVGVVNRYRRISRFYLYGWHGDNSTDSGLTEFRRSGSQIDDVSSRPVRRQFYCYRLVTRVPPLPGDRDECAPLASETVPLEE